jgi:hypothetical protein
MSDEKAGLMAEALRGAFLAQYFRAYFRDGKFFQATVSTAALSEKAVEQVLNALNDPGLDPDVINNAKAKVAALLASYCGSSGHCLLTDMLGNEAFITRYGLAVQFAGIVASVADGSRFQVALSTPKLDEWGPQLVRVFVEAVFDASEYPSVVPASGLSTACAAELGKYTKGSINCLADATGDIKEALATLDRYGAQTEAVVSAAVGKIIRGVAIAALDNEAIAKSVETLAGVTARKILEKALWAHWHENGGRFRCPSGGLPPVAITAT